ncbi:sugar ABC transporter substrate-binding protein [Kitasatospora sp. NA04385]|uniref:sugar ABC transporter substrate-binding protein n=1 Tax=Kitasatospora sp. NA04385 TaxID=2742135 RepID=UPI00158FFCCA|nr:sugar ABC transporter substrate-binding protein [Kitasatospora sp. NA04385]QKW17806.1 sugar ABC transporter substrate-binding protein [Kitasatospora sp. NA04385]
MKRRTILTTRAGGITVLLVGCLTACGGDAADPDSHRPQIGIDIPRADSDFWRAYAKYVQQEITDQHLNVLPPTQSNGDEATFTANIRAMESKHPKSIVMAPQNTMTTEATLNELLAANVQAVSVDTEPEHGEVYMVVRTDNRSYGTQACEFLGKQLRGKGRVAELQGSLDSINGYERSTAFAACMKREFPGIEVVVLPTDWKGDVAAAKLRSTLAAGPALNGIYMQAGGVFLQPTLDLLREKGLLKPAGQPGHITIVSNDGIPQELAAIRKGDIDATVNQPADLYAKYALYYAEAAAEGKTFQPGATDHDSTIVQLPNGLEDQLPSPLVTKDNVDDPSLWANHVTS